MDSLAICISKSKSYQERSSSLRLCGIQMFCIKLWNYAPVVFYFHHFIWLWNYAFFTFYFHHYILRTFLPWVSANLVIYEVADRNPIWICAESKFSVKSFEIMLLYFSTFITLYIAQSFNGNLGLEKCVTNRRTETHTYIWLFT